MRTLLTFIVFLFCLMFFSPYAAYSSPDLSMTTVVPESVGISTERLKRFEETWQREIAAKSFPGAITLIARDGKLAYFQTIGHHDDKQTKPMPADAIFGAASLTKPIVSVAAMMLVEQGRLKLGDPIGKHLKEFDGVKMQVEVVKTGADGSQVSELVPAERDITVYDLLRHTSGLCTEGNGTPLVKKAYVDQETTMFSPLSSEVMLERVAKIPLCYQPGQTFCYGMSTDILGLLLERVVGQNLDVLLKKMVLIPLKMIDTTFIVPESQKGRLPEFFENDALKSWSLQVMAANGSDGKAFFKGASGIYTTVWDYYRFCTFLLNGGELEGVRLLSPKTVDFMTSQHLQDTTTPTHTVGMEGPGYGFGLGFGVRLATGGAWFHGTAGDYSWGGAYGHYFFVDPKERFIGIFMSYGSANRGHVRQVFKNLAYGAIETEY